MLLLLLLLLKLNSFHLLSVSFLHGEVGVRAGGVAFAGIVAGGGPFLFPNLLLKSLHRVVDKDRAAEKAFRIINVPEFPDRKFENPFPIFSEPVLDAGQHGVGGWGLACSVQIFFCALRAVFGESSHFYASL